MIIFAKNLCRFPKLVTWFSENITRFPENVTRFPENVTWFSKIVTQFPETVTQISQNRPQFSENMTLFPKSGTIYSYYFVRRRGTSMVVLAKTLKQHCGSRFTNKFGQIWIHLDFLSQIRVRIHL